MATRRRKRGLGQAARKARMTTTKGWRGAAPKTRAQRRALYERCGARAFLLPNQRDAGLSKFPVMARQGACVPDCRGVRAALQRASRYGYDEVARKARKLARRGSCRWAE